MTKNKEIEKIQFGSSSYEIDSLANKVLIGEKVATSSLLDYYHNGLKKQSEVGNTFSILNSFGQEVTMVNIEKIEIIQFGNITEKFAIEEGDGCLKNWKAIHQPYYSKLLSEIGKTLNDETLLVCEWFKVMDNIHK
ncbi:MAG: ASCH domain-containing protein [Tannerellaceae bacterium]|jgi:uncharacterized protein YhfF|nr:ASCH domain-containing protein [Tannerellaceae bacterium]